MSNTVRRYYKQEMVYMKRNQFVFKSWSLCANAVPLTYSSTKAFLAFSYKTFISGNKVWLWMSTFFSRYLARRSCPGSMVDRMVWCKQRKKRDRMARGENGFQIHGRIMMKLASTQNSFPLVCVLGRTRHEAVSALTILSTIILVRNMPYCEPCCEESRMHRSPAYVKLHG